MVFSSGFEYSIFKMLFRSILSKIKIVFRAQALSPGSKDVMIQIWILQFLFVL